MNFLHAYDCLLECVLFVCLFACLFVSLRIQSPCQMMIGVYNHLLSKVFGFHYHSQKGIGSLAICSIFSLFRSLQQYSRKICFVWFPKTELFKEGEPVLFLFSGRLTNQRSWFFGKNYSLPPRMTPVRIFLKQCIWLDGYRDCRGSLGCPWKWMLKVRISGLWPQYFPFFSRSYIIHLLTIC